MTQPTGPAQTAVNPTWTWGSSGIITLVNAPAQSVQLAQVSLPEPAVCSLYLQASIISNADPRDVVQAFTVNLIEGVGRVAVPRRLVFQGQPSINGPLELTLPFVPLHALQVNIEAVGLFFSGNPEIRIETYLVLSPLTRIPQKEQQLAFGMATPGEADDLDDELREELETEGPTVQETILEGMRQGDASEGGPDDGDDDDGDDDDRAPVSPMQRLAAELANRLGRRPTRNELRAAVRRIKLRQQRRRGQ